LMNGHATSNGKTANDGKNKSHWIKTMCTCITDQWWQLLYFSINSI
jgi:hypothetical protein